MSDSCILAQIFVLCFVHNKRSFQRETPFLFLCIPLSVYASPVAVFIFFAAFGAGFSSARAFKIFAAYNAAGVWHSPFGITRRIYNLFVFAIIFKRLLSVKLFVHDILTFRTVFLQSTLNSVLFATVLTDVFTSEASFRSALTILRRSFALTLFAAVRTIPCPRTTFKAHSTSTAYPVIYRHCLRPPP